ncbi:MAG: two-component system cell cycle response regulator [Oceanospirillaceae bacterium]|jgi:two-component system cell cycle response regulator
MDILSLKSENQQLKKTLRTAMNEAKLNEEVLRRFIDIEVKMLSCNKLADLINLLLNDFRHIFKLSVVSIFLHNKDDLAAPLLTNIDTGTLKHLQLFSDLTVISDIYPDEKIRAGQIQRSLRKKVFPDHPFVLSCVLLPLMNKGRMIGSLHLGARELNRYHSAYRYEYLERMSALLAVCIENCIIRENLAYLSSTDMLTKLYNRHSFDLEMNKALQRANRQKQYLSLLFFDIDHFKQVNDKYGHPGGDGILKTFAAILNNNIRNTDFLARFGGEEFALLLPNCDHHQALQLANNLRLKVAEHLFNPHSDIQIRITTSIGVSCFLFDNFATSTQSFTDQSNLLLRTADEALYQAKKEGRNKVNYKQIPWAQPSTASQ